jgi:N-acetylmuramoyl-L-alanine amidase
MSPKQLKLEMQFQDAYRKLSEGTALRAQELRTILTGLLDGRWVSMSMFQRVQTQLAQVSSPSAQKSPPLAAFLASRYHDFLRQTTPAQPAPLPTVPYRRDHIPTQTPHNRRPGVFMTPQYLTIHSTGNPSSLPQGERAWLTNPSNERTASFHIVVDAKEAIECIPLNEVAWHAGDGEGNGNKKSISLEICESGDRAGALRNAIVLSAKLLRDHNLTAQSLRRHHDWATKLCPRILIVAQNRAKPEHTWEWFKSEVERLM